MNLRAFLCGLTLFGFLDHTVLCYKPCHRLQNGDIFSIGFTHKSITVITNDMQVFEVPSRSLNTSTNQLNLTRSRPVPFSIKWPTLFKAKKTAFSSAHDVFTIEINRQEYLFVIVSSSTSAIKHPNDFAFDLKERKVLQGLRYKFGLIAPIWLPSNAEELFVIGSTGDGTWQLAKMKPIRHLIADMLLNINGQAAPLCALSEDQVAISRGTNCTQSVTWPINRGFQANGKFYLFGSDGFVYTFHGSTFTNGAPVSLEKIPFERFFVCSKTDEYFTSMPDLANLSSVRKQRDTTSLKVAIIIAVLFSAVLVILVLVTFFEHQWLSPPAVKASTIDKYTYFNKYNSQRNRATKAVGRTSTFTNSSVPRKNNNRIVANSATITPTGRLMTKMKRKKNKEKMQSSGSRLRNSGKRMVSKTAQMKQSTTRSNAKSVAGWKTKQRSTMVKYTKNQSNFLSVNGSSSNSFSNAPRTNRPVSLYSNR